MNCEVFREKILQYLDDDLTIDEKLEMELHIKHCSECRRIYEEEKEIDDLFRKTLNDESIEFNSSVNKVMSIIDKDKYNKSNRENEKVIDLKQKRKSLRGVGYKYLATVASLLIVITGGIYFFKDNVGSKMNESAEISEAKMDDKLSEESATPVPYTVSAKENKEENLNKSLQPKSKGITKSDIKGTAMVAEFVEESIQFKKEEVESINEEFSTPWKSIGDSKEACITDKGKEAIEEGLSNIAIKDTREDKIEVYKMESSDYTPKFLEKLDNENLLVIIGFAHGTVARGGDVYVLNINTGEAKPLYINEESGKEQVIDIMNSDSELDLTIIKYDDIMNNYETFKGVIEKNHGEISNILKIYDGDKIVEEIKIK